MRRLATMDNQDWLHAASTRRLVAALTDGKDVVRFVGGCVRDALLGRPVNDVDLATPLEPPIVIEQLRSAGIKVVPTGLDHGTITAVVDHRAFEITTLRHDVETDGRRARVEFTDDWQSDAARRDFTINALSLTPAGELHDYFGGIEDLKCGRIRFVGKPEARIREDYLRLLRFFRFYAHFGVPPPDKAALAACRKFASELDGLSRERVRGELLKLLNAPDPRETVALMRRTGVLKKVLPLVRDIRALDTLIEFSPARAQPDSLLRLAALLPADAKKAEQTARSLRLSNREREQLGALATMPVKGIAELPAKKRRQLIYLWGRALYGSRLLIDTARRASGGRKQTDRKRLAALLREARDYSPPVYPLSGADVLRVGVENGPRVGQLLRAVEVWWLERDGKPDRGACLAELVGRASKQRAKRR